MNGRGTLVYVHGAMDRAPQVADQVALMKHELALQDMSLDVVPSNWGEAVGARLDRIDLAIPSMGPSSLREEPGALESVLEEGPLSELERLSPPGEVGSASAAASTKGTRDADALLAIAAGGPATTPAGLATACRSGALVVAASDEYARARCADIPEVDLVAATARAVAASAASTAGPRAKSETTGAATSLDIARDIEMGIAEAVLAVAAATLIAGYVGLDVGPGLKRWATDTLIPHRSRLMHDLTLGPADVLRYLRNGDVIRAFVAQTLSEAIASAQPVVVLGNSLGGIILTETLAEAGAPRPDLLVTVGTQAPLLQTIDALPGVGAGQPFQPWLNIYDRRDFAAFVAQPVWPDQAGIQDLAVDSGLGFPDSHGATYLTQAAVYQAIRDHPAIRSNGSDT